MPGDYTEAEITSMNPTDFAEAQARRWLKPIAIRPEAQIQFPGSMPSAPAPSGNVWASNGSEDFVCPSGQKCLVRKVSPEELLTAGILDKVTVLDGMAQKFVDDASGVRPVSMKDVSRDEMRELLNVINVLTPLAVLQPRVYADDATDVPDGGVRVSWIDLADRIAIMNHSLRGLVALQSFRNPGQSAPGLESGNSAPEAVL